MIERLKSGEEFFIWIYRCFSFLGGYHPTEMMLNSPDDVIYVRLNSYLKRKKITILEKKSGDLDFHVETRGFTGFFKRKKTLKDYFGSDVKVESIRRLAEMVQEHEGLMKELTG